MSTTCPHCGKLKPHPVFATCTRSECQEAEYIANRERNRTRKRVKTNVSPNRR